MAKIVDFKKHKKSKIILEDLQAILKVVNLAIKALEFYNMYGFSKRIVSVLKEEKIFILAEIEKNKGKLDE